jgi:ADP-ribosylglycohydrolase
MSLTRIRGALVGSVIGDCLGGIHDTLPQSFAVAAAN